MMHETFGEKVRRIRWERNWSQQELSHRAGVSTPHISSIERGKRFPSLDYAKRMADALGVSLTALCDEHIEIRAPKMHKSTEDLPTYLKNFVLNEASTPYLLVAQQLSTLPKDNANLISLMIDLLANRHRLDDPDLM